MGGCTRRGLYIYVSGLFFCAWTPNLFGSSAPCLPFLGLAELADLICLLLKGVKGVRV